MDALSLGITVTSLDPADGYGDWYTGHELGDALATRGWSVFYLARAGDAWYEPSPDLDAVVVLLDAFDIRRLPRSILRIAWVRNWVDRWLERPWFADFDVILASTAAAKRRIDHAGLYVATVFPIATNSARFSAARRPAKAALDVVFSGNRWGVPREAEAGLSRLTADGVRVGIYGRGWEAGEGVNTVLRGQAPYDTMPDIYGSAKIVVDDAATSTIAYGSVNSRVFDALAAGTIVTTSNELGVRELFDDEFPTWHDPASLATSVRALLDDEVHREALADRYREIVLAQHTYPRRAELLDEIVAAWEPRPDRNAALARQLPPRLEERPRAGVVTSARRRGRPDSVGRRGHATRIAAAGLGVGAAAGATAVLGTAFEWAPAPAAAAVLIVAGTTAAGFVAAERRARARIARELRAARRDAATRPALTPALEPDHAGIVVRLVMDLRPSTIIVLGAGPAAIGAGLAARRCGAGRVVVFEDDPSVAAEVRNELAGLDLLGNVEVVGAPLRRQLIGGEARPWYDVPADSFPAGGIDLLVVAGPRAAADPSGYARWPALPALAPQLSRSGHAVVLDVDQEEKRRTLERWIAEIPGMRLERLDLEGGVAVLRRADATPEGSTQEDLRVAAERPA